MKQDFLSSLRMLLVMTVVTGAAYPLVMTLAGRVIAPAKTEGSMIATGGTIAGSELIAQKFLSDRYFWPRPSAADFNPLPSGASNLGPTSKALIESVEVRSAAFISRNHLPPGTVVPQEMLFASGSGLDPHISPEAAVKQVERVGEARRLSDEKRSALMDLVQRSIEGPQFGVFGQPRVNVLKLNLELDREYP